MWKIRKSIDTITEKIKENKNVQELLASIRGDGACPDSETKMADGAEEVGSFFKRI